MVYIENLIQKKKEEFQGRIVSLEDFINILNSIGEINEKYKLEEEVKKQLYQVLYEKQGGNVNIEGIEALILQCLLEEQNFMEQNVQQDQDVDQLEIKSMNHIQFGEDKIISSYSNMTLDSINQLLVIYKKTVNINKLEDKEKCDLSLIVQQIENLNEKGNLQIERNQALDVFTLLSCKIEDDNGCQSFCVFNNDLQQYISKFENYLLLNKYGQYNVENYEQAFVCHESEEENTNDDSSKDSISDLDYQKDSTKKDEACSKISDQKLDSNEKQTNQFDLTLLNNDKNTQSRSSYNVLNDVYSLQHIERLKSSNDYIHENSGIISSMRELYPLLAELANRDEQSKSIVDRIEIYYSQLQKEVQTLLSLIEEKEAHISYSNQQNILNNQLINEYERKQEDQLNQNHFLEEKSNKLQDEINKLNISIKGYETKETEFFSLQKELDRLNKQLKELEEQMTGFKNKTTEQKKIIVEQQSTIDQYEKDLENIRNEKSQMSDKEIPQESNVNGEKQQHIDYYHNILKFYEEENEQLKQENELLKNQLQDYIKIIEEKEENNYNQSREITELRKQIEKINEQILNSEQDFIAQSKEEFFNNLDHIKLQLSSGRKSLKEETLDYDLFFQDDHLVPQPSIQEDVERNCREEQLQKKQKQFQEQVQPQIQILQGKDQEIKQNQQSTELEYQSIQAVEQQTHNNSGSLDDAKFQIKNEKDRLDSSNLKPINCFSFAALEIIQTSRLLQSKQNIQENQSKLNIEDSQAQNRPISNNHGDTIQNQGQKLNNTEQINQEKGTARWINGEIQDNQGQIQENALPLNQSEDHLNLRTPSFQQVLGGDASFYWNQLNKHLFPSNPSSFYKSPSSNAIHQTSEKRNNVIIQEFPGIDEESGFTPKSNRENMRTYQKQYSFTQSLQQLQVTDYLSLREDKRIVEIREQFENNGNSSKNQSSKQIDSSPSGNSNQLPTQQSYFYSDSIYRINAKNEKERRILCITSQFVYIINPMENFKLIRKFKVRLINRITFSNTNSNLCVIHVINQSEYVIESCRRFELNIFLSSLFKQLLKLPIYMISFAENLMIRSKKKMPSKIFNSPQQQSKPFKNIQILSDSVQKRQRLFDMKGQQKQHQLINIPLFNCHSNNSNRYNSTEQKLQLPEKCLIQQEMELQLLGIQLKTHQNLLKSLFLNPWKQFFFKAINNKVFIFKDIAATIKEMEFVIKDVKISDELHKNEKQETNEMQLIDQDDNSVYVKTKSAKDFELCLQYFQKVLQK